MTMQQINNNPQTPLEKLISDKRRIKRQCIIQKQKLNDDFSYIQEHAGILLLSGVTSLLFPNSKSEKKRIYPHCFYQRNAIIVYWNFRLSTHRSGHFPIGMGCCTSFAVYLGNTKGSELVYRLVVQEKEIAVNN